MTGGAVIERFAPVLFVLLWSTGWIVAKYSDPHSGPLTFLTIRFIVSSLLFIGIAIAMKSKWPVTRAGWLHALFSGLFLHAIYLGGIWWAIERGVPASVSGLLASLQPLMTAMIAYFVVAETLSGRQRLGLLLGFGGLMIAIIPGLLALEPDALRAASWPLAVNAISMLSVTIGTIYQKRFLQEGDLIPLATLQYVGAAFFVGIAMMVVEPTMPFTVNAQTVGAMVWSVFGLSLGAIMLLLLLIRRGQVSGAASLIFLIPPTVAFEAWLLFDEPLTLPLIFGTVVVAIGVWMVNAKRAT